MDYEVGIAVHPSDADTTLLASALLRIRSDSVTTVSRGDADCRDVPIGTPQRSTTRTLPIATVSGTSLKKNRGNANGSPCLLQPGSHGKNRVVKQILPGVMQNPQAVSSFSQPNSLEMNPPREVEVPVPENVRTEQVEAALRSKPQRGRKRNDLTERERLELTRTRNREHAKSTRIRKKARYQELEEKEAELTQVHELQALVKYRRQSLMSFFKVREQQIQAAVSADCDSSSEAPDNVGEYLHDTFMSQHDQADDKETGTEGLKHFDKTIAVRTRERFGKEAGSMLSYTVSLPTVASDQNVAFTEIDLVFSGKSITLLSAIVKVQFAPLSKKIVSLHWHTTRDSIDDVSVEPIISSQHIYPSVVSLDPALTQDESQLPIDKKFSASSAEAENGPGMSI